MLGRRQRALTLSFILAVIVLAAVVECGNHGWGRSTKPDAAQIATVRRELRQALKAADTSDVHTVQGNSVFAQIAAYRLHESIEDIPFSAVAVLTGGAGGDIYVVMTKSHTDATRLRRLWNPRITIGGQSDPINKKYAIGDLMVQVVGYESDAATSRGVRQVVRALQARFS